MRLSTLAAAAWLATIAPALAGSGGKLVGITRAVAVAERALAAHAFDAELETSGGRLVYEIELVRNGTLHQALVDAHSGVLLSATKPRVEGIWRSWFDRERLRRAQQAPPLATTLAGLERQAHGHVQEVGLKIDGGRAWYDVEIATPAGVADIRVDPASGRRLALDYDD